jgi:hypothetical protein
MIYNDPSYLYLLLLFEIILFIPIQASPSLSRTAFFRQPTLLVYVFLGQLKPQ